METCDSCGRESEDLTFVESVELAVCQSCLKLCFSYNKKGELVPVYDLD